MVMKKFAILAVTDQGSQLGRRLRQKLTVRSRFQVDLFIPRRLAQGTETGFGHGRLVETIRAAFRQYDCLICIMASGIVIRSIAPVIVDKTVDPAVIVMDERGHHVISLLSGHVGGANQWTQLVGQLIGADPVLTTATDTEGVAALDVLTKNVHGWYPNFKANTKFINGRLAGGQPVELLIDQPFKKIAGRLTGFTVIEDLNQHQTRTPLVVVSDRSQLLKTAGLIQVVPRLNVLGLGCRKNITNQEIQEAFTAFCQHQHLLWRSFQMIASIDRKQKEGAVQYLAATLRIPAKFYSAQQLSAASRHYPESAFVKQTVGVGNVACSAAEVASGQRALTERFATPEVTLALGRIKNS